MREKEKIGAECGCGKGFRKVLQITPSVIRKHTRITPHYVVVGLMRCVILNTWDGWHRCGGCVGGGVDG